MISFYKRIEALFIMIMYRYQVLLIHNILLRVRAAIPLDLAD